MTQKEVNGHIQAIWDRNASGLVNATEADELLFRESLEIPEWMRILNLISSLACVPTFLVAANHGRKIVMSGVRLKQQSQIPELRDLPWKPSDTVNSILFVISMPCVFSIMSLRSTCRIWALITGVAQMSGSDDWNKVRRREFASYKGDVELATAFQFFTVASFARLASRYLRESVIFERVLNKKRRAKYDEDVVRSAKEYRQAITIPAFLGVYSFVAVGILRCAINIIVAESKVFEVWEDTAQQVSTLILTSMDSLFIGLTVICVLNMIFICRMQDIKNHLGNANLKFSGTRLLLVIAQVQLQIISAFQVGSEMYHKLDSKKDLVSNVLQDAANVDFDLKRLDFSEYSAHLLHLSLLGLECLAVVIFNRVEWGSDVKQFQLNRERDDAAADYLSDSDADAEEAVEEENRFSQFRDYFCACSNGSQQRTLEQRPSKAPQSSYRRLRQLDKPAHEKASLLR
jgi:hypothetical protein